MRPSLSRVPDGEAREQQETRCALTRWCEREDTPAWLRSDPARARHTGELAASFDLNDDWEFDSERFRSAVEVVGRDA
jgi:hypothetical protein